MATKIRQSNITQPLDQDLSVPSLSSSGNISIADSAKIMIGGNDDLQLFHNTNHSYIDNYTGNLYFNNNTNDGTIQFATDDGTGGLTAYVLLNGSDGSVTLNYYGSQRLITSNTGVGITGNLTVSGDLTVSGNTVTLNTSTLDVEDINLTLASGAANNSVANGAGITIDGANATLLYQSVGDKFAFNKSIDVSGIITSTSTIKSDSAFGGFITLKRSDTTTTNNSDIGAINFEHTDSDDAGVAATILASGDGDAGGAKLRFYTGTPTSRSERLTILSNGNIGIGTDDPATNLEISSLYGTTLRLSSTRNSNVWTPGQSIGQIQMYSADGTAPTASVRASIDAVVENDAGNEVDLVFRTYNNTDRMRITSAGNVGIGTDEPSNLLHVKSNVNNGAVITLESTATDSYPFLRLKNDAREYQITAHGPLGDKFTIYDGTSATHRFTIDTSGNVGINNTSPQSTLDVRSTSSLGSVFRKFFNGSVANTASKVAVTVWGEDHDEADAGAGTSQFGPMIGFGARIDQGSPNTGDVRAGISYSYNGDLTFHAKAGASVADGSYERIRIDGASGYVGINHDAPAKMLAVNVSSDSDGVFLYSNKTQIGSLSRTTIDSTVVTSLDGNTGRDIHIGGSVNTDVILGYAGGNVSIGSAGHAPTHLLEILKNDSTQFDPDDIPTDGSGASILISNTDTDDGPSYAGINIHAYGASANITRGFIGIVNDENPYSGGWSGTDGHLSFGIRGRNFGPVIERAMLDSEGRFTIKSKDGEGSIHSEQVRHDIRPSFIADFGNSKELDSRFIFYRTEGNASTYYDKNGIIRYAVENEPRFDHDPVTKECKGLLIEGPHTNLLEDASRGTFGWSHDAVITRDNAAEAPDGTFDAFLLQPTTSDGKISAGAAIATSGAGTYTGSVWLKSATTDGSNVSMDIALYDVNTFYTNSITVTNEWQRFEVTYTTTNASTSYPRFYIGGASSMAKGEDVYVWGAQLETGDHATSYIPATEQFQSRAGTTGVGTYYDYEGKLTTADGNQERYGYKHNGRRWIPTGLIRESEATNLWNYSEDTYSYNWIKSAVSVSKRGAVLGPDGQYSAQRITAGAGSGYHYMYRSSVVALTSGKWYTVSFFAKAGTENRVASYHSDGSTTRQFIFNLSTKEFEYENLDYYGYEEAYDGWVRLWYTFQATANVSPNMHFFMRTTGQWTSAGGEYLDFFGFQLEEELNNTQNAGPTSYIKTEASTVTRGSDNVDCEYASHGADHVYMTELDWYNEEAGTLYYEASSDQISSDTGGGRLGFSYDEDNNNRIMANINSTSYALFIQSDGTTYVSMNNTAPTRGAMHKRAWAATTGEAAAYINGDQIGTAVNIVMPKINIFKLSNPTTDGDYLDGHIKKIAYYSERLSNATLKALTEND